MLALGATFAVLVDNDEWLSKFGYVQFLRDYGVEIADGPLAGLAARAVVVLDERGEIRRFVSVFNAVRQAHVEPITDAQLMQSAIRGLLLDLDPHSVYFEREAAANFEEGARGAYEGVGVELQRQDDGTVRFAPQARTQRSACVLNNPMAARAIQMPNSSSERHRPSLSISAPPTTSSIWQGTCSRVSLPASILEKSRMSLSTPSSIVAAPRTLSR